MFLNRVFGARAARTVPVWGICIAAALAAPPSRATAATLTTLASFDTSTAGFPNGDLIADSAGNLYGTTEVIFGSVPGTIFKFDPSTNLISNVATFTTADGAHPYAGLIAAADGNFYGTAPSGGASGVGTVFKLDRTTNTLSAVVTFNSTNGANPQDRLIADSAGNLYGTTENGGANGLGTVFKINPTTNTLSTLFSFDNTTGNTPTSGLLADAAGNLYGTTMFGGASNLGTIFKLDPTTNTLTTLVTFNGANGAQPQASLIADSAGNLYGTASGGTGNHGTIFRLDPTTNTLTTLATFNGANGGLPLGTLIVDAAGNLFGTTYDGGANSAGNVFKLDAATNVLTTLADFDLANGNAPTGGLYADAAGNLYGATSSGGANGIGVISKITGAGFAVPEPSTFALLAIAGLGLLAFRRRRHSIVAV